MGITATGRFCDLCSKNVVDFSSQSDVEIKAYLAARKDEAICGRFYRRQIDRIRIEIDHTLLYSGIPFWQKFLVVVLVCFGQQCFGIDFCFAQTTDSLMAPTVQTDSLATMAQDTLAQDTLTLQVKDAKIPEPEIVTLTCVTMISGSIALVPEHIYMGDVVVEERVEIPFPPPETIAEVQPPTSPGHHPVQKTPGRPEPGNKPDPQQNLAVFPPVGRKRRKRNKPHA
jgi:hypothetical protein